MSCLLGWKTHLTENYLFVQFLIAEELTNLLFDGVDQVDVVLRHQCDGHTIPPCGGGERHCVCAAFISHV